MNIVKNGNYFLVAHWKAIYESGQEVRIRKLIKGLFDYGGWSGLHVALWTWLSLDGKREKTDWFEKFGVPKVKHDCFACEEAETSFCCCPTKSEEEGKPSFCYYCPITNSSAEECLDGLYGKWALGKYWSEKNLEEREELAREIASLEWTIERRRK